MEMNEENSKIRAEKPERSKVSVETVKEKLKQHFNHDDFKNSVQEKAILSILNGLSDPLSLRGFKFKFFFFKTF